MIRESGEVLLDSEGGVRWCRWGEGLGKKMVGD
jgi:hypothetical protein